MLLYVLRRILLMVPTLVGVLLVNFVIIQAAPGGPVDQAIARLQGTGLDAGVGLLGGGAGSTLEAELTASGSSASTSPRTCAFSSCCATT